jgi:hypothetical protein
VAKIATVLEGYTTEDQIPVMLFLWSKGLNANDIHKEMFSVYGGECLSSKVVHNGVANVSMMTKRLKLRCGSGWHSSQYFYAAGLGSLVKRWGKCINVGGGYAEK